MILFCLATFWMRQAFFLDSCNSFTKPVCDSIHLKPF